MSNRKKKDPFASDAMSSSNTEKSNPFVSLFSGATGVLGTMMGRSHDNSSGLGAQGRSTMTSVETEEETSPATNNSTTSSAQFNFSPVTGREAFPCMSWVCSGCGKSKDLTGSHLEGKKECRSDCWSCAKKRIFQLCDADGHPMQQLPEPQPTSQTLMAGGRSHETTSPPVESTQPKSTVSPKLSFNTPPQANPPEATQFTPEDVRHTKASYGCDGAVGQWRCATCDKTKPLEGNHLKGKTQVRSDCWPCARKRLFLFHATGALPSPASFNLNNTAQGLPKFPTNKTESKSPNINSQVEDQQQTDNSKERASEPSSELKLLAASKVLLKFNSEMLQARYNARTSALRSCQTDQNRTFVQVPEGLEPSGLLAEHISSLLPGSDCRLAPLVICCHDESTFAAMSLFASTLCGFEGKPAEPCIQVLGPAFDKTTTEKTQFQELVDAANCLQPALPRVEVQVSHQASRDAAASLYDATGWLTCNSVGMAIYQTLEPRSGSHVVVLCGPSVQYKQLKSQLF